MAPSIPSDRPVETGSAAAPARSGPLSQGVERFADREEAGRLLADRLVEEGIHADIVLAIPRGGLPVGRVVAGRLGVPLDVVVAKKIGAPWNEELAIGAATPDGKAWLNEDLIRRVGISPQTVEQAWKDAAEQAARKAGRYRRGGSALDLGGKRVIVVDDGVATGATTRACLRSVRERGAASTVLAIPVGPPDRIDQLRKDADRVVCLATPERFSAVGQFYDRFDEVTEEEAIEILEASR